MFFYYAGHGLASRITFSDEDALVPADFVQGLKEAISVQSILRYFQATQFRNQFFILDACRDLGFDEAVLRQLEPRKPDPSKPAVQQFVFYATSPGLRAVDNGTLTEVLLDGLSGKGRTRSGIRSRGATWYGWTASLSSSGPNSRR